MKKLVLVLIGLAVLAMAAPAQAGITTVTKTSDSWTGFFTLDAAAGDADSVAGGTFSHLGSLNVQGFIVPFGGPAALAVNGGSTFNFDDTTTAGVARGPKSFTGSFQSVSDASYDVDYVFQISYLESDNWVGGFTFTASQAAVPEPATFGFLAVVATVGGVAMRRRKKLKPEDEKTTV